MKRTFALISFAAALAIAALAQTSPLGAKGATCGDCCNGKCGQTCCQKGCTDSCCQKK
jgi:hypothetical protein